MGNRSIQRALVKASAKNINTVITMTFEPEWVTLRTSDVSDVMDELHRLQRIESALLFSIESKIAQAGEARLAGKQAAENWEIEEKIHHYTEERKLRQESYLLSLIAEGKEVG